MMEKADAVAALGKAKLLGPALLKSALAANDRLKFTLTAVQAAAAHALRPDSPRVSLEADHAAAHMNAPWLLDAVEKSWAADGEIHIPDLDRILQQLAEDIAVMARPLTGGGGAPGGRSPSAPRPGGSAFPPCAGTPSPRRMSNASPAATAAARTRCTSSSWTFTRRSTGWPPTNPPRSSTARMSGT